MTGDMSANSIFLMQRSVPNALRVKISGQCHGQNLLQNAIAVVAELERSPEVTSLSFDSAGLTGWDSRFVAFIRDCAELCRTRNVEFHEDGLPAGVRRLLRLARAVPERRDARRPPG